MTGRSEKDGFLQRIGISFSNDGFVFPPPQLSLDPPLTNDPLTNPFGYNATDADGVIMAWRDPSVTMNPFKKRAELFFASKALKKKGGKKGVSNNGGESVDDNERIIACVGHAVPSDDTWTKPWTLKPPLQLPYDYAQVYMKYVYIRIDCAVFVFCTYMYTYFINAQCNATQHTNRWRCHM